MSNITVEQNNTSSVVLKDDEYQSEVLTAAAPVVWAAGTLLGRITASDKLTAYTSGASDGSEIPVAVLPAEYEFTLAGDTTQMVIVGGVLRRNNLVAHGVGAITVAESESLRDYGIQSRVVRQLAEQEL